MSKTLYHPYFCEENAWQLCRSVAIATGPRHVLFISNRARQVLLWHQRAAEEGRPVIWDYHVVMVAEATPWRVWDPDCRLGQPLPADRWLDLTLGDQSLLPTELRASFRLLDSATFLARFSTDRSHMRTASGAWIQPPPSWSPPYHGEMNLMRYIDLEESYDGEVLDLATLRARMVG